MKTLNGALLPLLKTLQYLKINLRVSQQIQDINVLLYFKKSESDAV
jgi:hypothetical protein